MLVRLISIVSAAALLALLLGLPAYAGQDHRSWSGGQRLAYADGGHVGSQYKKVRHADHRGGSKWDVQRGGKKRHHVTERHRPNSRFERSYKKLHQFTERYGPNWRNHRFKKLVRAAYRDGPGGHVKPGKRDNRQHAGGKNHRQVVKKYGKHKSLGNGHKNHRRVVKNVHKYKGASAKGKNDRHVTKKAGKHKSFGNGHKKRSHVAKKSHTYKSPGARFKKARYTVHGQGRHERAAAHPKRHRQVAFEFGKKGYASKGKKSRRIVHRGGPGKRFTPKRGKHKFIGRHGQQKCPPSRSKASLGGGKGKGYCQGHGYSAVKKHWHKHRRGQKYGRSNWRSQRYAYMWRAVNRYVRAYSMSRRS